MKRIALAGILTIAAALAHGQASSTEDFTGTSTANSWYYFNGACLTAGTGAPNGSNGKVAGPVPGCANILSYYTTTHNGTTDTVLDGGYSDVKTTAHTSTWADLAGQGALRFTNGSYNGSSGGLNENGAIISSTPFNAGSGMQITFKTVTYRGNAAGSGGDGADGISFYLIDATNYSPTSTTLPWNGIGSYGGSLGFSCSESNPPYDGVNGGYLAVGIDEYGNFLNGKTLVSSTSPAGTVGTAGSDNTYTGYGFVPQRIGLRGAGTVSWAYLSQTYPNQYPVSLLTAGNTTFNGKSVPWYQAAVGMTCQAGQVLDFSQGPTSSPSPITNPSPPLYDYGAIPDAFSVLPAKTIAGEWASGVYNRTQATPIYYKLTITQDGLLSLAYALNGSQAYTSVITNRSISSTNALTALPAKLYFAFAGSTGGSSNIHEIMCFKAAPSTTSSTSAAVSQQLSTKVQTSTQAYFSYYNPNDWTGRVTAYGLVDTNGVLTSNSLANWDAQCDLSNDSTCATVGAAPPASAVVTAAQREILTWNASTADASTNAGTGAVSFLWANLSNAQQTQMGAGDSSSTTSQARVPYLRGDKTNEINSAGSGLFRARNGVLGDIVDSSPAWVGPPTSPYAQAWKDNYLGTFISSFPENTGQTYLTFRNNEQNRLNVLYVGANDGMMHAFEAGSTNSTGALVSNSTTPNDGMEVLAYMPGYVQNIIHPYSSNSSTEAGLAPLDLSNTQYAHAWYVDGPPGTGDLYYSGAWHTWLVSGIGIAGPDVFALDITDPTGTGGTSSASLKFSTGASAPNTAVVVGEWSNKSISCVNNTSCGNSLGNVVGQPLIRKLHNGSWGAIFGNGINSSNGDAGIFILMVNPTSGAKTFYYFSTGATGSNGISYVTAADFDGDHITDYVYAGDLKGNVWRFDLTGCSPSGTTASGCPSWAQGAWGVTPGPLFTTASGQPITTPIVLASATTTEGTNPSVMLTFGTGQRTEFTLNSATAYAGVPVAPSTTYTGQSIYGVWDWNFTTWNSHSSFPNNSLTAVQTVLSTTNYTLSPSNLAKQVYSAGASGSIIASTINTINWCTATTSCTNAQFGWYVNLIGTGEQVVSAPAVDQQAVIVNSTIPANNALLSCTSSSDTGVSYVFNPLTGGTFTASNGAAVSAFTNNYSQTNMVGAATNSTGGLSVVNTIEGTSYIVGQSITPASAGSSPAVLTQIQLPPNVTINKKTWVQLR